MSDPDGVGEMVWRASVDNHKFGVVVVRMEADPGARLHVFLQETGEELLNEPVFLAFGAVFGPDVDDVAAWQVKAIDVIDKWIEAHPA